jgi:hypothetical protein
MYACMILLGAFAKVRKASINFVMSISPPPLLPPDGTTGAQLNGFSYYFYFGKIYREIQVQE